MELRRLEKKQLRQERLLELLIEEEGVTKELAVRVKAAVLSNK